MNFRVWLILIPVLLLSPGAPSAAQAAEPAAYPVPREHPYLLGPRDSLVALARRQPLEFARVSQVSFELEGGDHERMLSQGLVHVVTGDDWAGRAPVEAALKYIRAPIRTGHETFGADLARCALAYDLCWEHWTAAERAEFHDYFNRTVDANTGSEQAVFHNGWYSYKHWGYGLAALATYHENPRSPEIFAALVREYRERVLPAFRLAGEGGGWAEGYYVHYWTYKWVFFCEVARRVTGLDLIAESPEFLGKRAVAAMFESFPGISERGSRRPVPMQDGCGRIFSGERDENLSVRRILASHFRDDPEHQVVQAFNEQTPQVGASSYAYKDFLWRDTTIPKGDLQGFRLSHLSPGPGYIFARSSWEDDATYFFFKCGDRFTSHQHLDVGHFVIYKHQELAGDGGQFYAFDTDHEVNYCVRTIAHSTLLVYDPAERWPAIRGFKGPIGNDGGQHHDWPHHNGSVLDAAEWEANRQLYDLADLLAFEDAGDYLYVAGDCSRAYRQAKLEQFTRQIVFIRPGTFVIFDRVRSTQPEYRKSWLLQAMKTPERRGDGTLVVTNGRGRLFVQSLLPRGAELKLHSGENLYSYGGAVYPPDHELGPAPGCRVEFSPAAPARQDYFLHVLTATDSTVERVPVAELRENDREVLVSVAGTRLAFLKAEVGGRIGRGGQERELSRRVVAP